MADPDEANDQRAPRNPLRSEADAFRLLVMVVAAGAVVVAVTLLTTPAVGFALALIFIAIAIWRSIGLVRQWSREGSLPERDRAEEGPE
jgi:membrane protein implicated in regulation of membrane protease activity